MEFQLPSSAQMNPNATHYGLLAGMVAKTTGPVLELGVGHYSTPMLHFMCQTRNLLSVETSSPWMDYFAKRLASDSHKFFCTNNNLISNAFFHSPRWKDIHWDVALVDNGPETDRRKCVQRLRDRCKFIVIHDTEPGAQAYGWGDLLTTFKHWMYWDFYETGTTIVSDEEEIGLK